MRRTTTRRAASAGLGALAATTALALAAPSASAATSSIVLDPGQEVFFSVAGEPADEDQLEELGATLVPEDGEVEVSLPGLVLPGSPVASLVDEESLEESFESGEAPVPVSLESPIGVVLGDGGLTLTLPLDDPALTDETGDRLVDEVYLVVDGLAVDGFPDAPPFQLVAPLELDAAGDEELLADEGLVDGVLDAFAFVEERVETRAGDPFTVELPESSSLGLLGVDDLDDLDVLFLPLEEGDLELLEDSTAAGADSLSVQDMATAVPGGASALTALEEDASTEMTAQDDEDDLFPDVASDGRSATVTPAEELEAGEYLAVLFLPSSQDVSVVAGAGVVLSAAEPEPTPTVTVTQPGPTATVTVAPQQQNPGLRSNTGVEGAAPGLSDGGLVLLGSGLLAVAGVTGAAVARSSRRARG